MSVESSAVLDAAIAMLEAATADLKALLARENADADDTEARLAKLEEQCEALERRVGPKQ